MAKYKIEQINTGDEITYTNIYMRGGYSTGIVTGKPDIDLLSVKNIDKLVHEHKFIDPSYVLTIKGK
jgi:hypothetical protein